MTEKKGGEPPKIDQEKSKDSLYSPEEQKWLNDQEAEYYRLKKIWDVPEDQEETEEIREAKRRSLDILKFVKKLKTEREPDKFIKEIIEKEFKLPTDKFQWRVIGDEVFVIATDENDKEILMLENGAEIDVTRFEGLNLGNMVKVGDMMAFQRHGHYLDVFDEEDLVDEWVGFGVGTPFELRGEIIFEFKDIGNSPIEFFNIEGNNFFNKTLKKPWSNTAKVIDDKLYYLHRAKIGSRGKNDTFELLDEDNNIICTKEAYAIDFAGKIGDRFIFEMSTKDRIYLEDQDGERIGKEEGYSSSIINLQEHNGSILVRVTNYDQVPSSHHTEDALGVKIISGFSDAIYKGRLIYSDSKDRGKREWVIKNEDGFVLNQEKIKADDCGRCFVIDEEPFVEVMYKPTEDVDKELYIVDIRGNIMTEKLDNIYSLTAVEGKPGMARLVARKGNKIIKEIINLKTGRGKKGNMKEKY